jgi:hypothetical protein
MKKFKTFTLIILLTFIFLVGCEEFIEFMEEAVTGINIIEPRQNGWYSLGQIYTFSATYTPPVHEAWVKTWERYLRWEAIIGYELSLEPAINSWAGVVSHAYDGDWWCQHRIRHYNHYGSKAHNYFVTTPPQSKSESSQDTLLFVTENLGDPILGSKESGMIIYKSEFGKDGD